MMVIDAWQKVMEERRRLRTLSGENLIGDMNEYVGYREDKGMMTRYGVSGENDSGERNGCISRYT